MLNLPIKMAFGPTTGTELQLLKQVNDSFELDYNVLRSVLTHKSIGDRPISIVSIAGAFRTGKSFMLNFFLRYLRNKGYDNPQWMGAPSTLHKDGIQWRGGSKPYTSGINIWSEPLIVQRGKKEIAVIFLDTQGNSDHTSSRQSEVIVFVLSALLSSNLIYNIQKRIKSNDLEYLQFFSEHAKVKKKTEERKPSFQCLWFLIRDWDYSAEQAYGEDGGKSYLASVLETDDESSLKLYLREAFETVKCYLMPDPGACVKGANDESSFALEDIDKEFIQQLSLLAKSLLSPEALVVKTIDGHVVSGKWLVENIIQFWEEMKREGLAKSDTIMELTAKLKCQEYVDKGKEKCRQDIKKMNTSYMNDVELERIKQQAKISALKLYDENANYGGKEIIRKYREALEDDISRQFEYLQIKNDAWKLKAMDALHQEVKRNQEFYQNVLSKEIGVKWTNPEQLTKIHRSTFDKAMDTFNKSSNIPCMELVEQYRNELGNEMSNVYLSFKENNNKYEEDARNNFKILFSKAVADHKSVVEEVMKSKSVTDEKFSVAHERGKEKAINNYLHTCNDIVGPTHLREKYSELKLLNEIEKTEQLLRQKNESMKLAESDELFRKMRTELNDFIEKELKGKIVSDSVIKEKCELFSQKLEHLPPNKFFLSKWKKEKNRVIEDYTRENNRLREQSKQIYDDKENKLLKEFTSLCAEKFTGVVYVEEDELQQFIDSNMKALTEKFINEEKLATEEMKFLSFSKVEQRLKQTAVEIKRKNSRNKQGYQTHLNGVLGQIKLNYLEEMGKKLHVGYIEPHILEEKHEKLMKTVSDKLNDMRSNLKAFQEFEINVGEQLKSLLEFFHRLNNHNYPTRRYVIDIASNILTGVTSFFSSESASSIPAPIRHYGILLGNAITQIISVYDRVSTSNITQEEEKLKKEAAAQAASS